jgi:hypothetical protein
LIENTANHVFKKVSKIESNRAGLFVDELGMMFAHRYYSYAETAKTAC